MEGSTRKNMSRGLWLSHFNHVLYRTGTIAERDYRSMARMVRGTRIDQEPGGLSIKKEAPHVYASCPGYSCTLGG